MRRSLGLVVWITGLSGAGKSTVAGLARDRLAERDISSIVIDGDRMRSILPVVVGYDEADRRQCAMYYARLAQELAGQGHLVFCATVSLFREVHAWNRANLPGYVEVWLRVPIADLRRRPGRAAFYGRSDSGGSALRHVVGVETRADWPREAHLVIDNFGAVTAVDAAERVLGYLDQNRLLRQPQ